MDADKLLFTWNDFTVYGNGDLFTLAYQGKRAAQRTIQVDRPAYTAVWLGDILIQLTDETEGIPEAAREILVALAEDLLSDPDLLDWWTCSACGRETFAVPDEEWICVWCGTVADGDETS